MKLHESQQRIIQSGARFKVCVCGRGFGKTHVAVEWLLWEAVNSKGGIVGYLANTQTQARSIVWERLRKRTQDMGGVVTNNTKLEMYVPNIHGTTTLIMLKGFENVDHLRGLEFNALALDEIASMRKFWTGLEEVLMPTLRMSEGPILFIGTPEGFNHAYDLFNRFGDPKFPDWESFQFTSYDNPHISRKEIDKMKAQLPEDVFAQEYMADFRKRKGLVYKEFNRNRHVYTDTPLDISRVLCGVDFGYTNPAAVCKIVVDKDEHYWVEEEWYKKEQTTESIIDAVQLYQPNLVYPDHAEPDRIHAMRMAGLNVREISKDLESGIDHVRELFKQGRLHIHVRCKNMLYELETYVYQEKKDDKNAPEKPVKDADHLLDALRYALYSFKPNAIKAKGYSPSHKGYQNRLRGIRR